MNAMYEVSPAVVYVCVYCMATCVYEVSPAIYVWRGARKWMQCMKSPLPHEMSNRWIFCATCMCIATHINERTVWSLPCLALKRWVCIYAHRWLQRMKSPLPACRAVCNMCEWHLARRNMCDCVHLCAQETCGRRGPSHYHLFAICRQCLCIRIINDNSNATTTTATNNYWATTCNWHLTINDKQHNQRLATNDRQQQQQRQRKRQQPQQSQTSAQRQHQFQTKQNNKSRSQHKFAIA